MRILHIHTSDYSGGGGGAIAMYRLHLGIRDAGFDSKILCANKTLQSFDSTAILRSKRLESLLRKVTSRLGLNHIHATSSFRIKENKAYLDADVLNLHSFRSHFSYLALPSLTKNKPTVFTLHDMWPFTGHCAVSYDCDRWKSGCERCPYLDAPPALRRDGARVEWKLKDWVYRHSNLTIVTLSRRQTAQVEQSMLNRFPIHHIPNGVDTRIYKPLDPEQCRSVLGIPPGKKVIMFAALNMSQSWKGSNLLLEALQSLPKSLKADTVLLLIGNRGGATTAAVDMQALDLGYISNDRLKVACYSAADLFVHPTRADTLPLVLQESMACGTPMVSFATGGVPDLVRPGITGYLAEPENAQDLCSGIVQLLEDEPLRSAMGQRGREIALREYTLELQVQRYVELYSHLLQDVVVQASDMPQARVAGSA
jgi:glycosyltransferase involved in cell wall biosynthesis